MADVQSATLRGRRILVVEDEYLIAVDLAHALEGMGAIVIGPTGVVDGALTLIDAAGLIDGAVLDINLAGERVFPVADALLARRVPFVFATGYDEWIIPGAYAAAPRCEKPVETATLVQLLSKRIARDEQPEH